LLATIVRPAASGAATVRIVSPEDGELVDRASLAAPNVLCARLEWDFTLSWLRLQVNHVTHDCFGAGTPPGGGDCCVPIPPDTCGVTLRALAHQCPDVDVATPTIQVPLHDSRVAATASCVLGPEPCHDRAAGPYVGQPIHVVTGNMHYRAEDLRLPSPLPIVLERRYDSLPFRHPRLPGGPFLGAFGEGFRHSYEPTLVCLDQPTVWWDPGTAEPQECAYLGADGRVDICDRYWRVAGLPYGFQCQLAGHVALQPDGTSATYALPDGTELRFQPSARVGWLGTYRLQSVRDRRDHTTTLGYAGGRLVSLTDTLGRVVHLDWGTPPQAHVQAAYVLDDQGTEVYRVDCYYDPTGTRLSRVDYPDGTSLLYDYQPEPPWRLEKVRDGHGHIIEAWGYDGTGRATAFYREDADGTGPVDELGLEYLADRTVVTAEAGGTPPETTTTTYQVDRFRKRLLEVQGPCQTCGGSAASSRSFTWDRLRLARTETGEGRVVRLEYGGGRGFQPSKVVEARRDAGGAEEVLRTTDIQYDPGGEVTYWHRTTVGLCGSGVPGACGGNPADPADFTIHLAREPDGNVWWAEVRSCDGAEPRTRSWYYDYDGLGQLTGIDGPLATEADDLRLAYYDADDPDHPEYRGWLESLERPCGFDPDTGKCLSSSRLIDRYTAYDAMGRLLESVDPNGVVRRNTFDPRGRLWTETLVGATAAGDLVWSFLYDDHEGHLREVTSPAGVSTRYAEDPAHRVETVTTALEHLAIGHDRQSRVRSLARAGQVIDPPLSPPDYLRRFDYDALGRPWQVRYTASALGPVPHEPTSAEQTLTFTYTDDGLLGQVDDARQHVTRLEHDGLGLPLAEHRDTSEGTATVLTVFDASGRLASLTDAASAVTTIVNGDLVGPAETTSTDTGLGCTTYDERGLPSTFTDGAGRTGQVRFDGLGRLTLRSGCDSLGCVFHQWTYDAPDPADHGKGRLWSASRDAGQPGEVVTTTYRYSAAGEVREVTRTAPDDAAGTTRYEHDGDGSLTEVVLPLTGRTVTSVYQDGRLHEVWASYRDSPSYRLARFGNYPLGPVRFAELANGVSEWFGRDQSYALTWMTADGPLGPVLDLDHGYDADGLLVDRRDNLAGANGRHFEYDDLHRLRRTDFASASEALAYFPNGNRSLRTSAGSTTTYAYDGAAGRPNRLVAETDPLGTRAYTYNGAGDITGDGVHAYSYDGAGRLHLIDPDPQAPGRVGDATVKLLRDADGRIVRMSKGRPGTPGYAVTSLHHDLAGRLLEERRRASDGTVTTIDYVWAGDRPLARIERGADPAQEVLHFYHVDHLGLPIAITDAAGSVVDRMEYDAFAGLLSGGAVLHDRLRLPGMFAIDFVDGIHANWHREYLPRLGRYLQPDPILDPAASPYAYARSNPVAFTDPAGLCLTCPAVAFAPGSAYADDDASAPLPPTLLPVIVPVMEPPPIVRPPVQLVHPAPTTLDARPRPACRRRRSSSPCRRDRRRGCRGRRHGLRRNPALPESHQPGRLRARAREEAHGQ
jgi:RHS repeat-associated protein